MDTYVEGTTVHIVIAVFFRKPYLELPSNKTKDLSRKFLKKCLQSIILLLYLLNELQK